MVSSMSRGGFTTYRKPPTPLVMIGIDVGQRVDNTAIVVSEAFATGGNGTRKDYTYEVRYMERLPLGTPYPDVARHVRKVVNMAVLAATRPDCIEPRILVVIDATGVGRPVVELINDQLVGMKGEVRAATFTYGDKLDTYRGQRNEWRVGKAYLVSRLQALFQTDAIGLPEGNIEAEAMLRELLNYEIKIDEKGHDRYGAFKLKTHDDLVTALGLSVLVEPRRFAGLSTF